MFVGIARRWLLITCSVFLVSLLFVGCTDRGDEQVAQSGFPVPESFLVVGKILHERTTYKVEFVAIADGRVIGLTGFERFTSDTLSTAPPICWLEAKIGEPLPDSCK